MEIDPARDKVESSLEIEEAAVESTAAEPIASPSCDRLRLRDGLLILLLPLIGLLVGLRTVAVATLPHILTPDPGINYQEVTDRLPIPALLNWNLTIVQNLLDLRDMPFPLLILLGVVGGILLLCIALCLFNPIYRPLVLEPATNPSLAGANHLSGTLRLQQPKRFWYVALLCGVPLLGFWLLIGVLMPPATPVSKYMLVAAPWSPLWALRLMALGMALWVGLHPDGLLWNDSLTEKKRLFSYQKLLVRGALWGIITWVFTRLTVPSGLEPLLTRLQALGTFNTAEWRWVVSHYLFSVGAAWFAAGLFLLILGRLGLATKARFGLTALAVVAFCISFWIQRPFSASALARRFDLQPDVLNAISVPYSPRRPGSGVPDGLAAAQALARRLYLPMGQNSARPMRSVLLFQPSGNVINVTQMGYTINGLSATRESALKARDFLLKRRYHSALSWIATEHLCDCSTLRFDTTSALDVLLSDLSNGPHLSRVGSVVTTLFFICAATPQNHALLDKWANPQSFACPDRFSKRLIGDLYRRFGDVKNALKWYRAADMPSTFMARIRAERPLFHTGTVYGILRLNGRPLAGVRVGIMPWRLNGLPPLQEVLLANAFHEVLAPSGNGPLFPPFHPIPFAFRWISGSDVTDSNGAFRIQNLTEGQYRVVVELPPSIQLNPPFDPRIRVMNPPLPFSLHYANQTVNLGIIDIFYRGPVATPRSATQSLPSTSGRPGAEP
ncbi:hypothetical protein CTKA_02160 [Chthonomonas calidirosea]|uniref:Uncharacterized protein n=1 Tax=Chthonomonas calidirosea (strain DSM 23976 / ICMP 18418 / T49) TaxID=1303518 RepID=S0EZF1_CHTCT|nr:hypothetical protein [Chthonomonas calidirosea]CCW35742.1 hypothetical protein CCALI_01935 [Chthonomonas calidirosea T49]CEK19374.1 hypothetical protein CTKA_02160 [Chthonomonas calidirosea]